MKKKEAQFKRVNNWLKCSPKCLWWGNFVDCWLFFISLWQKVHVVLQWNCCLWLGSLRQGCKILFFLIVSRPLVSQGQPSVTLVCSYILSCCLFFDCVAVMKKKKKWMHEKGKWCHQSNPFACKGKGSTYNQLAKGHENILKGNWAHFIEILSYIPLTCSVLLRNSAYRQRHNTRPFCLYSVPKNVVIIVYSIILKLLFMCCFWRSMYTKGSNFPRQGVCAFTHDVLYKRVGEAYAFFRPFSEFISAVMCLVEYE